MCENESLSLEYIEDPYLPKLDNCITPSLDDVNDNENIEVYKNINKQDSKFCNKITKKIHNYNDDDDDDDEYDDDSYDIDENNYFEWSDETEKYLRSLTLDQIFIDIDDYNSNLLNTNSNIHKEKLNLTEELSSSYLGYDSLELQTVETEFSTNYNNNDNTTTCNKLNLLNINSNNNTNSKLNKFHKFSNIGKRLRLKFFTRKSMTDVKVTFIDFSKPYFAKISSNDNYKKFLNIGNSDNSTSKMSEPASPASVASADIAAEFASLTAEEQERQRAEWSQELARVEEEINTLRTVLASKTRHASDLKRKLGITVWKEITDDMNQGIKNVKESQVFHSVETKVGEIAKAVHDAPIYQKTEFVFKSTAEKTSSLFGGLTSGISSKLSQIKNSESMKSLEDKVGSAYENVKTKVSTSRSSSVASFNDALNENHSTTPNSPTIPEGKPLS